MALFQIQTKTRAQAEETVTMPPAELVSAGMAMENGELIVGADSRPRFRVVLDFPVPQDEEIAKKRQRLVIGQGKELNVVNGDQVYADSEGNPFLLNALLFTRPPVKKAEAEAATTETETDDDDDDE